MPPATSPLGEVGAHLGAAGEGASIAIHLISPPFAACHAGVNYYRALVDALTHEFPNVPFTFTLCCGDDPAIAHDALRLGFTSILCDCGDAQLRELQAMGGVVLRPRDLFRQEH